MITKTCNLMLEMKLTIALALYIFQFLAPICSVSKAMPLACPSLSILFNAISSSS